MTVVRREIRRRPEAIAPWGLFVVIALQVTSSAGCAQSTLGGRQVVERPKRPLSQRHLHGGRRLAKNLGEVQIHVMKQPAVLDDDAVTLHNFYTTLSFLEPPPQKKHASHARTV